MGQFDVRLPLFVFGTLLDRDLLAQVLGRDISDLRFTPGAIDGFRCVRARGESYPILAVEPGSQAEGALIDGLSAQDLARLAFFEADYDLNPVQIRALGRQVAARFFSHTDRLADSGEAWRLATWRTFDKPLEITAAIRWMAGFQDNIAEAAPLPEAA